LKAALAAMDARDAPALARPSRVGISGTVSLDASLKTRAAAEDNVFIFARNAESAQAGIPLAVSRHRVADLPVRFDLSDNNAMSPEAKLSSAAKVIVTARISKSGDARPQAGDLEGASTAIPIGTEKIAIVISRAR
jgi:cytochrome c-type biogenesis protein CcmH